MTDGTQSHLSSSAAGAVIRWVYTLADLLQILPIGYLDIEHLLDNDGVPRRVQWYVTERQLIVALTGSAYAGLQYKWLQGRSQARGGSELPHHRDFEAVGWHGFNHELYGARPLTNEADFRSELRRLAAQPGGSVGMHTYNYQPPIEKIGVTGNQLIAIFPEGVFSNLRQAWLDRRWCA